MDGPARMNTPALVPSWLANLAAIGWRVIVAVALGLVLLAIAAILGTVTASIIVALFVGAMFAPMVARFRARGWSRTKAAGITMLAALGAVGLTVAAIVVAFLPTAAEVIPAVMAGVRRVQDLLQQASADPEIEKALQSIADQLTSWITGELAGIVGSIATLGTIAVLAVLLTFFVLQDGDRGWEWGLQALSDWRRDAIRSSGEEALARVGGYLRSTALTAITDALTDLVYLLLLGVPFAGPLAVIVFFGAFIPYLGGIVTSGILLLATLGSAGPVAAVVLLALILVTNIAQARLVQRAFSGPSVHAHPAVVLVALPVGAAVAGIGGLIFAVPIFAVASIAAGAVVAVLEVTPPGEAPAQDEVPDIGPWTVPVWLDRLAQWGWRILVGIALVGIGVVAAIQVPIIVLPLVLAAVLAATFAPMSGVLERRGWSHRTASLVVTVTALAAIAAIVFITVASLVGPIGAMVATAVDGSRAADLAASGNLGTLVGIVDSYGAAIAAAVSTAIGAIAGICIVILIGSLLTYYFLRDGRRGWAFATRRMSDWRRAEADAAGDRAVGVLGGYMIGTGAISLFGAVTQLFIMVVLGLPYALPLAVLSFFGGFIPYIGSFITTGLAFLVTVAVGSPTDIVVMLVFTLVFNVVQGSFVAPLVYGRAVNIHPAIVLIAIPAGNEIAGIAGMFLVVPFLGIVATTWRSVIRLLDTGPAPSLPADDATAGGGGPAEAAVGGSADVGGTPAGGGGDGAGGPAAAPAT